MFLEIATKALREKNPAAYRQLEGSGKLKEYLEDLSRAAKKLYDQLTKHAGEDENQKAMVREVVIAQIVEEVEKPKPAEEASLM